MFFCKSKDLVHIRDSIWRCNSCNNETIIGVSQGDNGELIELFKPSIKGRK